jgi:hypothetical protein
MMMILLLHIRFQRGGVLNSDKIGGLKNKDFINI